RLKTRRVWMLVSPSLRTLTLRSLPSAKHHYAALDRICHSVVTRQVAPHSVALNVLFNYHPRIILSSQPSQPSRPGVPGSKRNYKLFEQAVLPNQSLSFCPPRASDSKPHRWKVPRQLPSRGCIDNAPALLISPFPRLSAPDRYRNSTNS